MNFLTHLDNTRDILEFLRVESPGKGISFLYGVVGVLQRNHTNIARAVLAFGIPFCCYYVYAYYRLSRRGYRISWQKTWLLIIASLVSIYIWGFHSFHEGFFVQNFFHSLQYFAIVIFVEHKHVAQLFKLDRLAWGGLLAAGWMIAFSFVFGVWASNFSSGDAAMSTLVTGAIMHYWYDGFIWSVKQKQV